jgi:hypothetical protein
MLGLKPTEFWRLPPSEYALMLDGAVERERRERTRIANAAVAIIYGQRAKRINLRQIQADLIGKESRVDLDRLAPILAESRKRVREAERVRRLMSDGSS